jgi:hypothetical protein
VARIFSIGTQPLGCRNVKSPADPVSRRSAPTRAAVSSPDREPSRLAATPTAPRRYGFASTLVCFYTLRAGTARGPILSLMQACAPVDWALLQPEGCAPQWV